ncbi:hypothetical protein, partial [Leucothrix pacifica]
YCVTSVNNMEQHKKLPDVIFIGPLKTATSYIYDYFLHHPGVATSEPVKELFYYDDYYDKGQDWYLSHFSPKVEHQLTIDVSSYDYECGQPGGLPDDRKAIRY